MMTTPKSKDGPTATAMSLGGISNCPWCAGGMVLHQGASEQDNAYYGHWRCVSCGGGIDQNYYPPEKLEDTSPIEKPQGSYECPECGHGLVAPRANVFWITEGISMVEVQCPRCKNTLAFKVRIVEEPMSVKPTSF